MGKAERTIQDACMDYLGRHKDVAFVHTTTTGVIPIRGGKRVKLGYPGMGDIIGMLKDGRFLSVEIKQPGQTPTVEQWHFINTVNFNGGLATWCDSVELLAMFFDQEVKCRTK